MAKIDIPVIKAEKLEEKPKPGDQLGFGRIFTDYMFVADYSSDQGWSNERIQPYGPIELYPSTMVLHYSQTIFEGLKAYRAIDGSINLFRPKLNIERLNRSAERLAIPPVDVERTLATIKQLVKLEEGWIPTKEGESLYIRPFIFATEKGLGVRPSATYSFYVILSPSGAYYPKGLAPVDIYIEDEYVRAVRGGMGFAKTGGNYAASIKAQQIAKTKGYDQVLWLDGVERRYIEEVGSMNVFFVVDGELITPELDGAILSGVTRRSVIELAKHDNIPIKERKIDVNWLFDKAKKGELDEAFGSGTAAVISPIGKLALGDEAITINNGRVGTLSQHFFDELLGIQYGRIKDDLGWIEKVE